MDSFLTNGSDIEAPVFVFAHGAGSPMDSEFMTDVATGLAELGIQVVRFEFPYMQNRRLTGKRQPPNRQPVLLAHFLEVIQSLNVPAHRLVIGGKSMGGRMASMVATEIDVAGVAVMGYPFHPLGKPDKLRIDHFCALNGPLLICQGERDKMGSRLEVDSYPLTDHVVLEWFDDGDHDLKPRKSTGLTEKGQRQKAIERVSRFIFQMTRME